MSYAQARPFYPLGTVGTVSRACELYRGLRKSKMRHWENKFIEKVNTNLMTLKFALQQFQLNCATLC